MTINYTTLLGLAEPVTGTQSGTWGDDVNKGITDYLDIAVAGTQTISGNQTAVTLSVTNGSSAGNNIAQVGTGSTGSAQYQIINCTGNPASLLTITAPASSKTYTIINATSTSQSVKIVGAGPTTGVTIASGEKAAVAWNGSDFVKVASSTAVTGAGGSNTQVQYNNAGAFAGSANLTFDGTTLTATGNTVISSSGSTDALRITQTGTGNALLVEDSANPDSTPFVINSDGRVGIGSNPTANYSVVNSKQLTGATTEIGYGLVGTIQSDVTTLATGYRSNLSTQATAFTLGSLYHFEAVQSTIGAGSSVTNQYGFVVGSTLTGATNNYGFFGAIPAGTGRYNFYAAGDADNYMAGKLGVGATPTNATNFVVSKTVTGNVNSQNVWSVPTFQSDVTSNGRAFRTDVATQAAAFTLTALTHYDANQGTIGAGSTVTNQYGFLANSSLTGATNNYGFYGNIASGSGRYNFYAAGTAANYFAGTVQVAAVVESTSGGFKFPDGTTQTTAATGGGSTSIGLVRAIAINCILP